MEHIKEILEKTYDRLENKAVFLPIVIANSIICHKLAHNDEVYWSNFSHKICERDLNGVTDMYLFFIDFLPKTSEFEESYKRKIDHIKEFDDFFHELFIKQKFYYKNPDIFSKHFKRSINGFHNPLLCRFINEIFDIASHIRFK